MVTIKKLVARFALVLTSLGLVLFSGCTPPGPRALLQGERLMREGKYAQAVPRLETAARLLPKNALAWNHLGLGYHHAGRPAGAVKAYQQALALDRNLAAAHYNLGCLYLEQNHVPGAVAELTSYVGLQPTMGMGWTKLGAAQLRARQAEVAEKCFRQALKLNADSAEALNGLGLALTQRHRYHEACQHFDAALTARRDYAPALLNAAIVSQQYLNERAFALQKYREYLALKPRPAVAARVQQLAYHLEQELHPPVQTPPTSPPAQMASLANRPSPASPEPSKPPPPHDTEKELKTATSPVTQTPAASPPQQAKVQNSAPARAAAATPPAPVNVERVAPPPPKLEVVRVTEDEPIKPARDVALNATDAALNVRPTAPLTTDSAERISDTKPGVQPPEQKGGFISRLNPRNWFQSKERRTSPLPTSSKSGESGGANSGVTPTAETPGPAPSASTFARYKYRSPPVPKAGDRGDAERLLAEGVRAQERNRLGEAIEAYRHAVRADPSFFDAYYNLGVAEYEAGDLPQCLSAYEYALTTNPISVKARFNFAVALQKARYPRDAANELEKLLADNPSEARAHFALANLYAQQLDEPDKAREHYRRLLELEPQHVQATAIRYWLEANP